MRDVAERAGVSITSVSHVINETRPVSDELRQRVLDAMDELGYQPNRLARSLRRGRTRTIGLIIPDSANPFFAEVARGIEDTSFEHDYNVILCNSEGSPAKERMYVDVLTAKQVDGILFVAGEVIPERIEKLLARETPVVVVDREVPGLDIDTVLTDNAKGGYLATRHLVELGHRRIACIAGPSTATPSAARVDGYVEALGEVGLERDNDLICRGDFQYGGGYRMAQELLGLVPQPTAIFACNDLMAVGALRAAAERGLEVPEDLSIVGFDDVQLASYTIPPLTTIAQPKYEIGTTAAEMLLSHIKDSKSEGERRVLPTRLVVRKSTGERRR